MIESVPGVCGGDPVIQGTRITCAFLYHLRFVAGRKFKDIVSDYPHLKPEDIEEAITHALRNPEFQNYEADND